MFRPLATAKDNRDNRESVNGGLDTCMSWACRMNKKACLDLTIIIPKKLPQTAMHLPTMRSPRPGYMLFFLLLSQQPASKSLIHATIIFTTCKSFLTLIIN
jgi:hypothetical protein